MRTVDMEVGKAWGSAGMVDSDIATDSYNNMSGTLPATGVTVSVPTGTYNNCIMVQYQRSHERLGGNFAETAWYCPNVGLVRKL